MEFQSSNPPQEGNFQEWTVEDDKLLKDALAIFDENTPDRWAKIAAVLPTKKFFHVLQYYKELEEELLVNVPNSPYPESSTSTKMEIIPLLEAQLQSERENLAMLEAQLQHEREHIVMLETQLQLERERNQMPALVQPVNNFHVQPLVSWNPHATFQVQPPPALQAQPPLVAQAQQPPIQPNNVDINSRIHEAVHMAISQNQGSFQVVPTINHNYDGSGKRSTSSENERKKRIHWTDEEHMSFLLGLQKCGPGKWRDISRKFVCTKSPTQVASHAQKYHNRQILSKDNKRRRTSIHDMVINPDIQETTTTTTPHDEDKAHIPFQQSQIMPSLQQNQTSIQEVQPEWMNYINYDLYNNESFMVSDPNCDDMFMSCSKDHEVAAAQDLYGYAFPQTFGEPHSQDFMMASSSSDFHNDSIYNIPPM